MARDGSGGYSLPEAPFVYDTVIDEAAVNANFSDIATALTGSLASDGQTDPSANLPMATFRHTGVGNASARTDYAAAGQVQDGALTWCGTATGTANALALTPSPSISAYAAGQRFAFKAGSSASTDAVTVTVSGQSAKAVEVNDAALSASVTIEANKYYEILYDGTAFQLSRLSEPSPFPADPDADRVLFWDDSAGAIAYLEPSTGLTISGTAMTVDPNNATDTVIATGDQILFADASDSNATKKDTVQGILDLGPVRLLETLSPSSASDASFTSNIDSTYSVYEIVFSLYSTGAADLYLRVSTNGGSSWLQGASDYAWSVDAINSTSGSGVSGSSGSSQITVATLNANSGRPVEGRIRVYGPSTSQITSAIYDSAGWDGSAHTGYRGQGTYKGAGTVIDALQLLPSANAFTGTVKLYGIR